MRLGDNFLEDGYFLSCRWVKLMHLSCGVVPESNICWNIMDRDGAISLARSLSTLGGNASGPDALCGLS